jgi:hypothetical protein
VRSGLSKGQDREEINLYLRGFAATPNFQPRGIADVAR